MNQFKVKKLNYRGTNTIFWFIDYAESNLHNIGKYNGSLALYRKCLDVIRWDSSIFRYGEDREGDIKRLNKFMNRCCREIGLWKSQNMEG